MRMKTLLQQGVQKLQDAQIAEAELDAMYLLEHVFGMKRMDFLLNPQQEVSEEERANYLKNIALRAAHSSSPAYHWQSGVYGF